MFADLIRFEDFELDARNYCLRRSGANLKLERIPMELLLLLVGRAGQLVTREQIIETLWGKDVYLDTENAINTAIRKIRLALGDDPAQPRFVQTVTGRGYRFIAEVIRQGSSAAGKDLARVQSLPAAAAQQNRPTEGRVLKSPTDQLSLESNALAGSFSNTPDHGRSADFAVSEQRRKGWLLTVLAIAVTGLFVLSLIFMRSNAGLPHASNYVQITNDGQAKRGPLLTDGLRLYFSEGTQNHRTLAQVSASGGETTGLSNPLETPYLMDITPNRYEVLVGSSSPGSDNPGSNKASVSITSSPALWILALPAGGVRRAGGVMADDATWSPDGHGIAYVRGNALYRAGNDGSAETKLADLPGAPSWPRWSPDGTRLRFTLTENITSFSSIWEISADGKMPHPVLPGWNQTPSECCGNWTPDGKYFVFQSTRDGKTEIWAIKEKQGLLSRSSGEPVQLTAGQINSLAPTVSSNGTKLYVIGQQLRGELARHDSKSGEFVPYLSGISAEFVDFSRDGKWVTYVAFPSHSLWRSRVDGTERLQLTLPPVQATVPRWSPDGKRIAFFDAAPGKPWRIYLISSDGGTPEPLLNEQRNEMDPNWSPDGNFLIFSYFPIFEKAPPEKLGVFEVDLRTRNVKKLPGSDGLWVPRWSLDGRYLVARSLDSQALMLFDFETQTWTELARGVYFGFTNWSADGQSVYYLRRGREPAVFRLRIADRKTEEIASLKNVRQTGFRGAIWMGLALDDSPLLLRDIGTQEIYALDLQTP
jgi:Tol biopolymer transport system component/DNA-binding winged helix-turn-helix (wHTH) protein